jgi:hypothetical protein
MLLVNKNKYFMEGEKNNERFSGTREGSGYPIQAVG